MFEICRHGALRSQGTSVVPHEQMRINQQAVEHWELIVRASSGSGLDVTVASFPLRGLVQAIKGARYGEQRKGYVRLAEPFLREITVLNPRGLTELDR